MEYRVLLFRYDLNVAKAQEKLPCSQLELTITIQNWCKVIATNIIYLLVVTNAAAGLGQGVDTLPTYTVALVDDDGE